MTAGKPQWPAGQQEEQLRIRAVRLVAALPAVHYRLPVFA
jgi:hypothetical protein